MSISHAGKHAKPGFPQPRHFVQDADVTVAIIQPCAEEYAIIFHLLQFPALLKSFLLNTCLAQVILPQACTQKLLGADSEL